MDPGEAGLLDAAVIVIVIVIAWLSLAAALEALDRPFCRERGDRAAYLLSLAATLVTPVALSGTLAVLGLGGAQFVGALALSGLAILGAALGGLGLLELRVGNWPAGCLTTSYQSPWFLVTRCGSYAPKCLQPEDFPCQSELTGKTGE